MAFHPHGMDDHPVMLMLAGMDGSSRAVATAALRVHGLGRSQATSAWSTPGPYRNLGHSFYAVLAGEAAIAIDGHWFQLRPGRLYAIPGHRQVQRKTAGFEHLHADFTLGALSDDVHLGRLDRVLDFPAGPWSTVLRRACALGIEALPTQPSAAMALEGVLLQVVAAMREAAGEVPLPPPSHGPVAAALAWLDRHYLRMPSLAEVARAAGRSPAHLHACFTAAVGRTPTGYALDRRMGDAHQLLTGTALAIMAVAERCGYADPLHFSRVVRRYFGCSPQQMRAWR
jgi:AraC-like DNA-binding protein